MTTNGMTWAKNAAVIIGLAAAAAPGVGAWYVMDYRLTDLETDRRDYLDLKEEDARLGDSIRRQWPLIGDLKDRVTRLEVQVEQMRRERP